MTSPPQPYINLETLIKMPQQKPFNSHPYPRNGYHNINFPTEYPTHVHLNLHRSQVSSMKIIVIIINFDGIKCHLLIRRCPKNYNHLFITQSIMWHFSSMGVLDVSIEKESPKNQTLIFVMFLSPRFFWMNEKTFQNRSSHKGKKCLGMTLSYIVKKDI